MVPCGFRWSISLCLAFVLIGWTLSTATAQTHGKRIRLARNGSPIRTRLSANIPVRHTLRRNRARAVPLNPGDLGGYSNAPAPQGSQGGYGSDLTQPPYPGRRVQGASQEGSGYSNNGQVDGTGYSNQQSRNRQSSSQKSRLQNGYDDQQDGYSNQEQAESYSRQSSEPTGNSVGDDQQSGGGYTYEPPQRAQQQGGRNSNRNGGDGYVYKAPEQSFQQPSQDSRRPNQANSRGPSPAVENGADLETTDEEEQPAPVQPQRDYYETTLRPTGLVESEQNIDAGAVYPEPTVQPVEPQRALEGDTTAASSSRNSGGGNDHHNSGDDVWPDGYKGVIPGEEGVDYPVLATIPDTSFNCNEQQYSGYYADPEARCQVFHVCLRRATRRSIEKWSFLCPNGTLFSQEDFVCVWWNNAQPCDADTLSRLYQLNAKLGWDSQDDTGMKTIQNIMDSMVVSSQLESKPPGVTTQSTRLLQQPDLSEDPVIPDRPNRIPVRLTASLGTQGIRKVNLETSVPVTTITDDSIVTAGPNQDYDGQDQEFQAQVDTSRTSQSEAQSRTKSGSAYLKSESEAYEQFGDPGSLENPKPFIVNNPPGQENRLDDGNDRTDLPSLMMLPVQQQYPDGSTSVVDMPVMVIPKQERPVIGFPPAAVVNPNGVTIPNRPVEPPRSYLPPRRDPTTTQPSSVNPVTTNVPVQVEEEVSNSYDYVDTDKEPPGTKPVIDFEVNSDSPEPVTPEGVTEKPVATYLPPRGRPAILTGPDPDFDLPANEVRTEAPTTTTAPVTSGTEEPSDFYSNVDRPVTTYKPARPTPLPALIRTRPQTFPTTATALEAEVVSQILQAAGMSNVIRNSVGATTSFPAAKEADGDDVQYPTPGSAEVNQDNAPNVGTSAQLYNGNVRNIYSQKATEPTTTLPSLDKDKNNELLKQIQYGGYNDGSGNNDVDSNGLERITPGYIELPGGNEPTESSRAELPGTESVQAFLTSQKNVDPKQTLQIYEFDKYALFVPKEGSTTGGYGGSIQQGTPAPAGLVRGPTSAPTRATSSNPGRNIESLFGPRAKDVLPQILSNKQQQEQQSQSGGYSQNPVPVPSKPSGLYETPSREYSNGYQTTPASNTPNRQSRPRGQVGNGASQRVEPQQSIPQQQVPARRPEGQHNGYNQNGQNSGYNVSPTPARPPSNLYLPPTQPAQRNEPQRQEGILGPSFGLTLAGPQIKLPVLVEAHTTQTVQVPQPTPQGYQQQSPSFQQQQQSSGYQQQPQSSGFQPQQQSSGYQQQQQSSGFQPQQQSSGYQQQQQSSGFQPQQQSAGYPQQQQQQQQSVGYQQQQPQQSSGYQQQPSGYPQQQQQQRQVYQQQTGQGYSQQPQRQVPVPNQQAPPVPIPQTPSLFYAPPTVDEALNLLQPQSSALSNAIQLPTDTPTPQLTAIQNAAEFIPAIPVHSQTFVETRRVPPQNPELNQLLPSSQELSSNNLVGQTHVVNPPFTQIQPQFFNALAHNNGAQQHFSAQSQQQQQQQQQNGFQPILRIQNQGHDVQVHRAAVQPIDISQLQLSYPQGTHYDRSSTQPQASVTGYRSNVVDGRELHMFNPHEGVNPRPDQHQTQHQNSHQQNVQNFIEQARLQAQQDGSQNLQHYQLTSSSSQAAVAVPPPSPPGFYPGKDNSVGVKLTY